MLQHLAAAGSGSMTTRVREWFRSGGAAPFQAQALHAAAAKHADASLCSHLSPRVGITLSHPVNPRCFHPPSSCRPRKRSIKRISQQQAPRGTQPGAKLQTGSLYKGQMRHASQARWRSCCSRWGLLQTYCLCGTHPRSHALCTDMQIIASCA